MSQHLFKSLPGNEKKSEKNAILWLPFVKKACRMVS